MSVRSKMLRAQQSAACKRAAKGAPDTVRIVVQAGKTFRGVMHYVETKYDASTELARRAVAEGVARLA